ncbi:MARTX multifunctional-autoprocessing repeats-in-toxin holotoxin RtxA [Xenorhabdus budapestensis]|uniref:MARTX multifunctional-autoprocessing repeats-in-toxin holotoxin RtxA n=1 Tax=Xenorhabdus budapestensis TaxID=290110 RepID=UPI003A8710D9
MGKSSNRSAEYFFTGKYEDDNDGNTIHAIGVGGVINAYGGNDYIVVGSIGATVNTTWGHDTVVGGAGYLNINDTSGFLTVKGGAGYATINKTHNGTVEFVGAAGGLQINHTGNDGSINYSGISGYNGITRKGVQGDIQFKGTGGGNVIKSNVTKGNVYFNGAGIANFIEHTSEFGNTEFNGAGGANVIIKKGKEGNLSFNGAGVANVLLHQGKHGDMEVNAGGAANVLIRVGDGRYLAHLLAIGNISIHKGNGNSRVSMGGGFNTHTQIGHGDAVWSAVGGANVLTKMGQGHISSILAGGANILTKIGEGDLEAGSFGGANIITHISSDSDASNPLSSDTKAIALGGANILTKKGKGNLSAVMGGGANVLTHVGDGTTSGIMLGGANILTKVGNGDTTGIMLGLGNALTHVGDGQTLGVMAAAGNIFTKVGDGDTIAAMLAVGNIFTHVGEGNAFAMMAGGGNIFTKVGNGDALALMLAFGNVFTHIGDGTSVALMIAKGNIATKAGNGDALAAMIGKANIFTQIGHGSTFAAMIGGANVLTKVGNGLTAALMVGKANIFTHVGEGTSIGLFAGTANIMTKVGDGTTLAAMFGKANVMTHVGDGLTGVLALGKANIVTKVGNDFLGVVAASEANVVTHVGEGTTAALLSGKGNVLTKVGDGTAVGLLVSKIGNIMTHVGDGTTVGFAKGEANIITKVGDGSGVNAVWGKANILTHYGDGDRYNFAKGEANIITKVGEGQEITVVQGQANIVTHVGNGDDYTGAWGKANAITKVGDGRNVVFAKGDANIVTQIGEGDSFNALWSQGNLVTKVGDGTQVTAAKGKGNIITTVGNGLSVAATHGDLNVNTKVGDGVSVNVAWGKFNVNTRVGDGLNISVMKGTGNANIRVGDGLNINASYARNNVAVQIGNGDFYSLAVAESNTQSNKLGALFDNIKQTLLGTAGSQGINYLVNGDEANTSGTHKGRGAIDLPEISSLNGFKLTEIDEVTSELHNNLKGSVSEVGTPDTDAIQNALSDEKHVYPNQVRNLITNGDFEQGSVGWLSTNGVEADFSAESYGLNKKGHGERVSELDTNTNTRIYQDINDLTEGESITVSFDFAKRTNISADNGMCVLWNGEIVFSVSAGDAVWSNKTLTLKAQEGINRLEFAGTGKSDGLGYVLDNIVAQSELSGSDIAKHVKQNKAARNALQDKEKAEADRQRLEQERDKQLTAVSGTQAQLENTDLDALETNGQSQRDSINDEAQAITKELMAQTKGLEVLNDHAEHHGQSGSQWRDQFAGGLLGNLQSQLDSAKETAQQQLERSQQASSERLGDMKDAVTKSESGVLKGEQNHQQSLQDIEKTRADIELREQEAIARMKQAEQASRDGKTAVQKAEQRGQHAVSAAEIKTAQVQSDAKGAKLDGNSLPNRTQATGNGLSVKGQSATYAGNAFETTVENHAEKANSHIDSDSSVETEEGLSMELQYLEEDLNELDDAKEALDRLQINAGVRIRKRHTDLNAQSEEIAQPSADSKVSDNISVNTSTGTSTDTSVSSMADMPVSSVRKEQKISGLDLSGLKALGEIQAEETQTQPEPAETSADPGAAIRAQKVADVYRWLDSDNDMVTENYIPVPGFERVDADIPDDLRQKMVNFVEGYLNGTENSVPEEQRSSLAKLFVDATIDYDWDKRVEFISRLEHYGYSFEPTHGDKSIVSFWSGKNFKQYRDILDAAQTDGKKVVYDIDVKGNSFAIELNKTLVRWGGIFLDSDNAQQNALQSVINASARSNTGFWSSVYATGSRDDVYVIAEGGLRLGNYFWNVELPVLRQLQREGLVGEIRLLDKAAKEYQGVPPDEIGRRLTEAGVSVKARFDLLSLKEQEKLLALNPDRYKPDTLIDLNIKTSAIDNLLNQALPFYGLRVERNLLVHESDDEEGFEVRPWPGKRDDGSENESFKTIIVQDQDDTAQIRAIERFILANYDNYAQLPDALHLVDDRIVSHDNGRTRILAEKVEGSWRYQPRTDLMSVSKLQEAAYVKGKIRGDSYQNILDALRSYENVLQESKDYDLHAIEKLAALRHQVEGYLLGHPDSERAPTLKNLLSQINVRINESTTLAESTVESSGKGSFSELYNKLGNANLKDSKHLYIDEQGDFVTRGKSNIQIATKAESAEKAIEQVKASVTREYGQSVTEAVFSNLNTRDLAKDGKGIDVSGLKKIHQAIEQQLSPISATLFIWKPSDHSRLGHAALQIGHGRIEVSAENAGEFNEKNYVSWWPKGGKSTNISRIFDVSTSEHSDVRLRWRDLSQPAAQHDALALDIASEENDKFDTRKREKFIEELQVVQKGIDARFKDISEGFAMAALANPNLLKSAGIPEHISRPFMQQWEDSSIDMLEVGKRFAEALRTAAKRQTPELIEEDIVDVIRQFAEHELSNIQDFQASEPDQGRVFRINLAGLDAAAMQAEWHKISQNPDARYQLLTGNCSSIVARVLKAGGADQVIGHKWRPHFGVWTPTELFNYAQALQVAQVEHIVRKPNRLIGENLTEPGNSESKDKNKVLENVAIDNDGTPPREREPFNPIARFLNNELYGAKDARRNVNEDTQILLDHAVNNGTVDKVTLRGSAGRLTGYYHLSAQETEASTEQCITKKVVLFIHGSGSSAEEQAGAIQHHYQKQDIDLLAVNMRGYGSSDGHPSEKGLYQDARTMFHYLVNDRGIKPENIIIHGYSMGGPIAADLARYAEHSGQPVSGLLLDRPMPSMTKAITAHEVPNPAGITGVLAKAVNGQFSVEKNLQGISKQTPIMLLTDNEGLGAEGEKLRTKLKLSGYSVSGEHTFYGHEDSNRLIKQFARQIVTNLFDMQHQPDKPEILKDIWGELKNVGEVLKPQVNKAGITTHDIRTTEDFLAGYKQGHAKQIVDGFRSDMSIKQLADLLVKGNWSAEQKGALTWEIESRAVKVTFQDKAEKFNLLFRDVASTGIADAKASEQLAPQSLFLNLSNDGYGGRCDPLSKLVLVAKQLENDGQDGVARKLLEKMYSTAAVLSNPDLYSDTELANANKFLGSLAALHARNPMYETFIKVWEEKLEGERALTVNGVINKVTAANADGKSVLLELDVPGHAMSAWAKGSGENRVYGFYDPNVGIIEFSSVEKFGDYMTRFFGKTGLNMENSYKMPKNDAGEAVFYRVVVIDGGVLATYKPTHNVSMRDILDLNVFDETPMKARTETEITDVVKSPLKDNESAKTSLLEKALYSLFDAKSGGKELDEYSLHFNQGESLINNLKKLIPEIGDVRLTNGNHVESKEFLEGLCFALSARYMMEERVHGSGGGKKYMVWLMDAVKAYNDNTANKKSDINSVEASLLNQYRRQYIGSAIEDLLLIQYTQTQYLSDSQELEQKANEIYGGKLKDNGLTGKRIDWALKPDISGYEFEMDKLRNVNKTTYMSFMSENHAMAITVHKETTQTIWSFYDPNFGIKSFNNYENFRSFMDSFYKGIITGYKLGFPYRYEASKIPGQSFYVNYNAFEDGTITDYDGIWQQAREGEQPYVLRALKEQGKTFQLGSDVTGRVVDYRDDTVTLEVVVKRGQEVQKVQIDVESNNFKQAANLVQSNINKLVANSETSKLTLNAAGDISITDEVKSPLKDNLPEGVDRVVDNKNVASWERVTVTPQAEGSESRFDGQVIIQTENDPTVAKAAASLAGKHPDTSVVIQLDANGEYRVVYGEPAKLSGKLRWQIVGHGSDESTQHLTRMAGYSADELALKLKQFSINFKQAGTPEHISLVGCSLIRDDKRDGFARRFISALDGQGIRTTVSARSSEVAIDSIGRKHTRDAQEQWTHKLVDNKIVLGWNDKGEMETRSERIRRGISENDITLSRVGHSNVEVKPQGAIAENTETFHAPKQYDKVLQNNNAPNAASSNQHLSYSGNIQVQVGDGEFTVINWGTTNVGIKVGTGGFKSLAFGDNNVMVHIGHGDSKHSVDIAGYQAFEGAQLFVGNRNVSFNLGRSNDLIVMLEKSIPTPPLVNPFDGAARISGVLQDIASSQGSSDWLTVQDQQWSLEGAKKYVSDLSGLDLTSSVKYETLTELNTENERSSRGLKNDIESTLNKKYNQWLGGAGNKPEPGSLSRADKFRQANEKLAFNFAVGGQGADIQVTTGNWNFMFGDNIQSILDTNLGSLFGLMTQQYTSTGMAKTTFTFSPTDLPRQIKNKLLGNLAGVRADTTLADIFGVDYTPDGRIISRSGQPVDGVAILREMLEIIGEFSGDQLKAFTDPDKLLDGLKAGLNTGADGIKSFAESHGLKAKAPADTEEGKISLSEGNKPTEQTEAEQPERAFGFNALNLPNLFATLFNQDKQAEMKSLVTNLKENLTADLLNMKDKTFDFLRNSGHLQGDGDIHISLGNYNFNWSGDGKDLGAYLGDNNNVWGGRGDDVFYSVGTSNIFTGGEGNDVGVLMGRENMMFGDIGNDVAVLAGRINYAYMGDGNDQVFAFGENGVIQGGKGRDYIVASGNFNHIDAGEDQDYVVTIGNNNQVDLGEGDDFATVFGNYNRIDGNSGSNSIKLMGYHAVINGGTGNDHLIADVVSKFSQFNGGDGDDLLVLGGYQNRFKGGTGVNSFVVSGNVIDNVVEDIKQGDKIVFNDINWQSLWFQRSGYDLVLLTNRNVRDSSVQGQFETIGSVTFNNYFNGNRADIITLMGDKDAQGEREYKALSDNAVDTLVQAMSGFSPNIGASGFIDSFDSQTKSTIITAWTDTTNGKSKLA